MISWFLSHSHFHNFLNLPPNHLLMPQLPSESVLISLFVEDPQEHFQSSLSLTPFFPPLLSLLKLNLCPHESANATFAQVSNDVFDARSSG